MSSERVKQEISQCLTCRNCSETEFICKAFPFGIPKEIIRNEVIHDTVIEGQQGNYVYKIV
jgi:hypothetical protein